MITVLTDEESRIRIAANVRAMLKAKGLSQSELSRMTNETPTRISFLVRGSHTPSVALIIRVAEALQCSLDDLVADPETVAWRTDSEEKLPSRQLSRKKASHTT